MGDKVVVTIFFVGCLFSWCLSLKPHVYCEVYSAFYGGKRAEKYGLAQAKIIRWIGPVFIAIGLYQLLLTFGVDLSRFRL